MLSVQVNSTQYDFHGCKVTEKGPKILINRLDSPIGVSSLSRVIRQIFKQFPRIFNPMAINVQKISLTNVKLHFLYSL